MADKETNTTKLNKAMMKGKIEKYGITKRTAYSSASILACIALIVIMSIVQATFDITKLKTVEYWVNLLISIAICIFGMIAGRQIGDDTYRNNPTGQYRMSLNRYSEIMKKLMDLKLYAYIDEWLEIFRRKKLQSKIEMTLLDAGIQQKEVLDLDMTELHNLSKPFKKDWSNTEYRAKYFDDKSETSVTYFKSCTTEQIRVIQACKAGKVKVSRLYRSFFVNAFNQAEKDMWESSAHAGKKKGMYMGNSYIYKIITLISISMLLSGLTPVITDDVSQATLWLTMISRMFTLITSIVWGAYTGINIVKIDMAYLDFKVDTMSLLIEEYNEGIYKPRSVEQQAREEYDNAQKKTMALAVVHDE